MSYEQNCIPKGLMCKGTKNSKMENSNFSSFPLVHCVGNLPAYKRHSNVCHSKIALIVTPKTIIQVHLFPCDVSRNADWCLRCIPLQIDNTA